MIDFFALGAATAGLLFSSDVGVIAIATPALQPDFPIEPLGSGFMTAAVINQNR